MPYYAVRPTDQGGANCRIEKATSPKEAFDKAFGRGFAHGFEWKNLGTRISVVQSDKQRIALLNAPEGWVPFPQPNYKRG